MGHDRPFRFGLNRVKASAHIASEHLASPTPAPHDVRKAIDLMRARLRQPLSLAGLAEHCGVAERTLHEHFRSFMGCSPVSFHRRLRLAAARDALRAADPATSVTEVVKHYGFNHAGRFSEQYREGFGEPPSATLRRARAARRRRPAGAEEGSGHRRSGGGASRPAAPSQDRPSVLLLPAAAPSNEPALRWLAEAVAEGIAAALPCVRALAVVTPTRAQAANQSPQRLARETGARYLLSGKVVQQGQRVRFILRLVDLGTDHHIWGDSFEGDGGRPLELQDRIVAGVLRNLGAGIRGAEIERASSADPRDLDAHGLAMRSLPLLYASTAETARRAIELLHRAIDIDPDDGLAAALAAWGHAQLVMYNGTGAPAEEDQQARHLTRIAAILGSDDPLALTARCAVHMSTREFDIAEALVTRALARDPNCGWAWGRSGWLHSYRGNSQTAIRHFRRALLQGPGSTKANILAGIGSAHFHAGRYAAAASWIRRAMVEQPDISWANRSLSVSYARLGETQKAQESLTALRRTCPDLTVGQVVAAVPFRPDFLDRLGDGLSALGLPP